MGLDVANFLWHIHFMKVFLDLETTGIDTHGSEVVEAYMVSRVGELHLYNKPRVWSKEAEKIHKIPYSRVQDKPEIEHNIVLIFDYLRKIKKPIEFWCYTNTNNFVNDRYTDCHFDVAILEFWSMMCEREFEFRHICKKHTRNSVWALAKKMIPNLKGGYSQQNVAKYLGINYNPHNAREDVHAMIQIYKKLSNQGVLI